MDAAGEGGAEWVSKDWGCPPRRDWGSSDADLSPLTPALTGQEPAAVGPGGAGGKVRAGRRGGGGSLGVQAPVLHLPFPSDCPLGA